MKKTVLETRLDLLGISHKVFPKVCWQILEQQDLKGTNGFDTFTKGSRHRYDFFKSNKLRNKNGIAAKSYDVLCGRQKQTDHYIPSYDNHCSRLYVANITHLVWGTCLTGNHFIGCRRPVEAVHNFSAVIIRPRCRCVRSSTYDRNLIMLRPVHPSFRKWLSTWRSFTYLPNFLIEPSSCGQQARFCDKPAVSHVIKLCQCFCNFQFLRFRRLLSNIRG